MKNKKILYVVIVVLFVVITGVAYIFFGNQPDEVSTIEDSDELVIEPSIIPTMDAVRDMVVVHVCGHVRKPGVYELKSDMRITDAISVAGGFTKDAATEYHNLAEKLVDGQKIYIPSLKEAEDKEYVQNINLENNTDSSKININTATKEELMTLTGVGVAKAQSIIEYRQKNGLFTNTEDIMKIQGIKEGLYNKIKDFITIN